MASSPSVRKPRMRVILPSELDTFSFSPPSTDEHYDDLISYLELEEDDDHQNPASPDELVPIKIQDFCFNLAIPPLTLPAVTPTPTPTNSSLGCRGARMRVMTPSQFLHFSFTLPGEDELLEDIVKSECLIGDEDNPAIPPLNLPEVTSEDDDVEVSGDQFPEELELIGDEDIYESDTSDYFTYEEEQDNELFDFEIQEYNELFGFEEQGDEAVELKEEEDNLMDLDEEEEVEILL